MKINNTNKNASNKVIVILAIIVIVLSLISIFINISKVSEIRKKLTGDVTGYVNLTVNTQINLNITNAYVNFSAGTVTAPALNATITTHGNASATATNGNWSTSAKALAIANVGNINCSINISGTKTAVTFFGGSAGQQQYQWNISSKETNACGAWNETSMKDTFANVNLTTTSAVVCNKLDFAESRNEMWIDFKLVVPYDATVSLNTPQWDTITISADAAI